MERSWQHSINGIIGKIITLIQLGVSIWFISSLWISGMMPMKFLMIVIVVALVMFLMTFGLQFVRSNGANLAGMVLSVLFLAVFAVGTAVFLTANSTLANVGGATYKTDNMLVVVREDDPAETITDAKDYLFGRLTSIDQENTDKMLDEIRDNVGQEISILQYDTVQEEAQALLDGEVEAAVYNEAYASVIEETIEGYTDKVKILHNYGIKTEIEAEEGR